MGADVQITRSTKLFKNGGSVAVRLPAEFSFSVDSVVYLTRDDSGRVTISPSPGAGAWNRFMQLRNSTVIPADFMADRPMNEVPAAGGVFDGEDE